MDTVDMIDLMKLQYASKGGVNYNNGEFRTIFTMKMKIK